MQSIKELFFPVAATLEELGSVVLLVAGFNVCFAIFVAWSSATSIAQHLHEIPR